ncbi:MULTISPECIES: BT_3987 domain-containing protein [Sphingobacterium]|uniref:BT_3987 domain-containing protein n=1 Tax=Sphingobacterium TaxID=28453 RepID=UPI0013DAFC74|nr:MULTISPECIES: DUF1735 domain-containing protein [unclassified Sphingobacterium]
MNRYIIFLFSCFITLLISCKKEESQTNLLKYVSDNIAAYDVIPVNGSDHVIANMNYMKPSDNKGKFPVILLDTVSGNTTVSAEIDTSYDLIVVFDGIYGSSSPILTSNRFKIEHSEIQVKAGKLASTDSVSLMLNDINGLSEGIKTFVVPVRLKVIQGSGKLKSELMYIRYKVNVMNLKASVSSSATVRDLNVIITPDRQNAAATFRVTLNQPFFKPVVVTLDENNSATLAEEYNKKNNTEYIYFPRGSYKLLNTATVAANQLFNATSIKVQFDDVSLFKDGVKYILPLKTNYIDYPSVAAEETSEVSYLFLELSNILSGIHPVSSGPFIDKTNWALKSGATLNGSIGNIKDNDNTTHWISVALGGNGWFSIDMKEKNEIRAFQITPAYGSYRTSGLLETDVLSSDDGVNWKLQGVYYGSATSTTSSPASPDIKVLKFKQPVKAQHFKFIFKKSQVPPFAGLAEINAIQ